MPNLKTDRRTEEAFRYSDVTNSVGSSASRLVQTLGEKEAALALVHTVAPKGLACLTEQRMLLIDAAGTAAIEVKLPLRITQDRHGLRNKIVLQSEVNATTLRFGADVIGLERLRDNSVFVGLDQSESPQPVSTSAELCLSWLHGHRLRIFILAFTAGLFGRLAAEASQPAAGVLYALILFSAVLWAVAGLFVVLLNRDHGAPARPRSRKAKLRDVPSEPPRMIQELANFCTICGRPLTNLESRKARVGSTCIKTYGPRPRMVPNPAHASWTRLLISAQAIQRAEQAALDSAYTKAAIRHEVEIVNYQAEKLSSFGRRRAQSRTIGVSSMMAALQGLFLAIAGMLAGWIVVLAV